jgi:hypothetical protein
VQPALDLFEIPTAIKRMRDTRESELARELHLAAARVLVQDQVAVFAKRPVGVS